MLFGFILFVKSMAAAALATSGLLQLRDRLFCRVIQVVSGGQPDAAVLEDLFTFRNIGACEKKGAKPWRA